MIEEAGGRIDYDECGAGPTIVLVPGSCSTGAAWRPMIAPWNGAFRCVTTSLLGYGGTTERRSAEDSAMSHEAAAVESVIRRAGGRVHLVGHSFGGLVALAVALRNQAPLAGLVVVEAPAAELLRDRKAHEHYRAFRRMTDGYFAAFAGGNMQAIAAMIDFYGGTGTFASWPPRVRAYAVETTPVNMLDWASAYGFPLSAAALAAIDLPVLVLCGAASHPAAQRANALVGDLIPGADFVMVERAAHFMIATYPGEVAGLIARHVHGAQERSSPARAVAAAAAETPA